jgi:hypothetical protein
VSTPSPTRSALSRWAPFLSILALLVGLSALSPAPASAGDPAALQDTVLTLSPDSGVVDSPVTFTITLTTTDNSPVDGTVSLNFNGTTVPVTITNGVGSFTAGARMVSGMTPGTYLVSVSFAGDLTHNPTHAVSSFRVQRASTIALDPVATQSVGTTITPSVTLASPSGSPTGSLTFTLTRDGAGTPDNTQTVTVNGGGSYVAPFGFLVTKAGGYTVAATYSGDTQTAPATTSAAVAFTATPQNLAFSATVPTRATVFDTATVAASTTSGITPTLDLAPTSTGCTLRGTTLSFTDAGTCVLQASAQGGVGYEEETITRSIPVVAVPTTRPTLTATVSAATKRNAAGWYRTPVTVTFTCGPTAVTLTAPCPGPVRLGNGASQSVARTITTTDGLVATASVGGLNIDTTAPKPTLVGLAALQATPTLTVPKAPRCQARDALSGVASCQVSARRKGDRVTWTATARDVAGNTATTSGGIRLARMTLDTRTKNGIAQVRAGRAYTLEVRSASRPRYVVAVKAPRTPYVLGNALHKIGPNRWAITVRFDAAMTQVPTWNIGVRIKGRTHVTSVHVTR